MDDNRKRLVEDELEATIEWLLHEKDDTEGAAILIQALNLVLQRYLRDEEKQSFIDDLTKELEKQKTV